MSFPPSHICSHTIRIGQIWVICKKMHMSSLIFFVKHYSFSNSDYSCQIQYFQMVLQSNCFFLCNLPWLFLLSRIKACVPHINSLNDTKFKKLLQRIAEKTGRQVKSIPKNSKKTLVYSFQNETIFTLDELNKLENAFEISLDNIKQMIEALEYMFLQSAYHLVKPQVLQNDLVNEQNFDENKVKFFLWKYRI